jgi:hypothetical protein
MRQREQRLWDRMRTALRQYVRLERVENVMSVGMPDVIACANGRVVWIENKAVEAYPKRAATPVLGKGAGLSQEQMNWHAGWKGWGGKSLICVGVGPRDIYVLDGIHADLINTYTQEELALRAVAVDWEALSTYLRWSA